ncbi:MAG: serine/threonine-protein kinase [Planctomycetota bacterium]
MPNIPNDRETDKSSDDAARTEPVIAGELPREAQATLNNVWKDACTPDLKPEMTIRPDPAASVIAESTLVIKERTLRTAEDPTSVEAEYELIKVLGEGGMGVVHSARQTSIDRVVAVKMLRRGTSAEPDERQKFLLEAVITADLDHPNIVPIFDLGVSKKGAPFYSMKRVRGTPWSDLLKENSRHENVAILMRVADAIAFAHARGVIHRDLKPENVMLGEFGEVLVMDWGLAHPTSAFERGGITGSSGLGGTPLYMAPELALGPISSIGPASDVYLLGAILYEILTGKPPHQGDTAMKCVLAAAQNVITPTDESGELVDLALKSMSTDPEDRHANVQEFQAAIREYLSHTESNLFADRAGEELVRARRTDKYPDYAKAMFAFEEACSLWAGNTRAQSGLVEAKLAYARGALAKGDLDLAGSLLDEGCPDHEAVRANIERAKIERRAELHRQKRRQLAVKVLCGSIGVLVVLGVCVTIYLRQSALRLADLHAPAVHESTRAQSGLARSLGSLRGWVLLGTPRFERERAEAWKQAIRPSVGRLGVLVDDGGSSKNEELLEELTPVLDDLEEAQWWTEEVARTPGNEPARVRFREEVEPVADDLIRTVGALIDLERVAPDGKDRKRLLGFLADLRNALVLSRTELSVFLGSGSRVDECGFRNQFEIAKERVQSIDDLSNLLTEEQRVLVGWTRRELPVFERLAWTAIDIRKSEGWNIAQNRLREEAVPLGRKATVLLERVTRRNKRLMRENVSNVSIISTGAAAVSSVLAVGAFLITWLVSRKGAGQTREDVS